MVNVFKKVIEFFHPLVDPDPPLEPPVPQLVGNEMTAQFLKDEIVQHFKYVMNKKITREGNCCRILFPMSFNIILNPKDFEVVGEDIPHILPMALLGFYNAIREKIKEEEEKNGEAFYEPPAKSWFFQWAESQKKEGPNGNELLPGGSVFINSSLTKIEVTNDNVETIHRTGGTVRIVNSNTQQRNDNPAALGGATISASKTSEWNFDKDLPSKIKDILTTIKDKQNAMAILSYEDGRETKLYSMLDQRISVSGLMDTRNRSDLWIINSDKIKNDIFKIQYLKKENKFQISAYGDVRVNEHLLPVSESNAYNWQDLPYRSHILLPDVGIQISFKASDAIISRASQKPYPVS